jgi:hypothetical protein
LRLFADDLQAELTPDRDAEGAVEIRDLGRPAVDLFDPPIKAPPTGKQ